jgi:peptidoglycan DL-endopeptidase CwlO
MMASSGPDWQNNAATQIRWGLTYIHGRYGSPCGAWAHEEADNWY